MRECFTYVYLTTMKTTYTLGSVSCYLQTIEHKCSLFSLQKSAPNKQLKTIMKHLMTLIKCSNSIIDEEEETLTPN